MSGTVPTGFTDAQKVDVRRFCGYPAYGAGAAGFENWRFFQAYGSLEFRLNNLAPGEIAVTLQYLNTLASLEAAIPPSSANLDTESAAAWTHNPNETADRMALFDNWRRRLCGFLGIPVGPELNNSGISLVV
ncbi:MAG: hypothetical protein B7Z75_04005 [Acidocella sp. 20-57-95]|nr:MAG: hypothetical protein B7Z75_04005 [Acidocella sp. 20-57-95]OYV57885.1 MAG: hypothetical protein B7Z71_11765 [Acidocella sp. 21-58-7]HQT63906.1 hypothetical protein [Acidocella sp.]HQU05445.1 hypothetical protein [Acidocella sp.]